MTSYILYHRHHQYCRSLGAYSVKSWTDVHVSNGPCWTVTHQCTAVDGRPAVSSSFLDTEPHDFQSDNSLSCRTLKLNMTFLHLLLQRTCTPISLNFRCHTAKSAAIKPYASGWKPVKTSKRHTSLSLSLSPSLSINQFVFIISVCGIAVLICVCSIARTGC